jgi:hypothetical protein
MDKKKLGALIAAVVAALTAFWYTYNAEVEKAEDTAPVVESAPVAPVEAPVAAPVEAPVEAPVAPAAPVEVK